MDAVDWSRLAAAVGLYRGMGYEYVELPWFADPEVLAITCADRTRIMEVTGFGGLLGSAEQAFLAEDLAGRLPNGRCVACTPCFRAEPIIDRLHLPGFMKVELFRSDRTDEAALRDMLTDAVSVMSRLAGTKVDVRSTDEGCDIEIESVEVGSYGIRSARGLTWVFGTGLAEPRFSTALALRAKPPPEASRHPFSADQGSNGPQKP